MVDDAPPGDHDEPDDSVFSGILVLLFLQFSPELSAPKSEPRRDDGPEGDRDSAVDDASATAPIVESAAGAGYFPAPGTAAGPPTGPTRDPWAFDAEAFDDELWERQVSEHEQAAAIDELLAEHAQAGVPSGWLRPLWRWAHVFGVEERVDAFLGERERALGLDPIERPARPDGDLVGLSMVEATRPERLYAALKFFEEIDPSGAVSDSPREYRIARDVAIQLQGGLSRELIDRWLAAAPPDELADADRHFDEDAPTSRLDELSDEFSRGATSLVDLPETWLTLWGWAHAFGVIDEFVEYFEERRRVLGIPLFEPPDIEEFFAGQREATEQVDKPQLLYAIINHYERIDPTRTVATSPQPYLAVRDFAIGSLDESLARIYEALDDLTRPAPDPAAAPIAPPTMTTPPPPSGGEELKSIDPHALEPQIDGDAPAPIDSGVDDASGGARPSRPRDPGEEGGTVQVEPMKLELDPGPGAGLDSAVDDADSNVPVLESRVGAEPFPAPGVARSEWRGAQPAPPAAAAPSAPGRRGEPPNSASGTRRVAVGTAAVAAVVIAILGGIALFGGDGDGGPEAVAGEPTAAATEQPTGQPTGTASAEPTAAATEQPAFELTEPPTLVICNDGSSFSGIEQPDGTFTDPDTGEVLSCG